MKKILLSTLLLFFAIAPAFSQRDGAKNERSQQKEKMEALKTAFFVEKLEMTEEESEAFFARQDSLNKSLAVLNKDLRELRRTMKDTTSVSDEQYAQRERQMAELQKEKIDLNSSFVLDCFDILDAQRAIILTDIEKDFRKEILASRKENAKKKETQRTP